MRLTPKHCTKSIRIQSPNHTQSPPTTLPFPPPFEVRELSSRGLGVIANRTIEKGERLFAHTPLGIFHNHAFQNPDEYEKLFNDAVDQLPQDPRELFRALASHEGDRRVVGRLNTNAFGATFGGEPHVVLVPETAVRTFASPNNVPS